MDPNKLLLALLAVCVVGGAVSVLRPLVGAIAKRIADGPQPDRSADHVAALRSELLDELEQVRQQVSDLGERVDFAERLLARQREGQRIGPGS